MPSVTIDFLTRGKTDDEFQLVLVEQGPWDDIDTELYRLQDRLYTTLDVALEGEIARLFPESQGKVIVVRIDGYDLPDEDVAEFFDRFAEGVLQIPDYAESLRESQFVAGFRFELNLSPLPPVH